MANIYYNGAVDSTWNTIGNWWTDSSHSIAAGHIPQSGDTVYIDSNTMSTGPSSAVSLAAINVGTLLAANVTLNTNAQAIICFHCTGSTGELQGTTYGDAYFYNGSINAATITGNGFFYDTSWNNGTINGNAIFNNSSYNYSSGVITGNSTFNNSSLVNGGTLNGNVVFNNTSFVQAGTINGNATFNDSSYCSNASSLQGFFAYFVNSSAVATLNAIFGLTPPFSTTSITGGSGTIGINGSSILGLV